MAPEMTVALMVDRRRERGARVLQSVLSQSVLDRLEILLFDFGHLACPPLAGSEHPAITTVPMQYPSSIGEVRLEAFRKAQGSIVAFLEEHTVAFPGWAEALLNRFAEGDWAGVGAEVYPLNPGWIGDALFTMNYPRYIAPAAGGPSVILQGNNSAYRRDVVLCLGDDLTELLEIEALLNWRLAERGCLLYVEPEARFAHANEHILYTFLEGDYIFSRMFGALRAESQGWTAADRWSRVFGSPAIPFVRTLRLIRSLAMKRPELLPTVVRALPAILAAEVASVAGQTMGLVFGPGRSRQQFLFYELNTVRDELD